MPNHPVVSREEWTAARKTHLEKEKALDRQRDALAESLRSLPWVRVEESYVFSGPDGEENLADLFAGRSQLIVQHFMYGESWDEGCPSCSFWADGWDPLVVHLEHRDVSMVAISKAPLAKLQAYRERMGWSFKWLSSAQNEFNRDFHVSATSEEVEKGETYYNYRRTSSFGDEMPGMSVFYKDDGGVVYHTYSTYARGLDRLNAAYHYLDMAPKGRDESELPWSMAWLRRHDSY